MVSILLDSNILIYAAKQFDLADLFEGKSISYASVSAIEALGYGRIPMREVYIIQKLLEAATPIHLDVGIINTAIQLRQQRWISLGDSIIAASALLYDMELWTHNTKDFQWISGLKLHDPLA